MSEPTNTNSTQGRFSSLFEFIKRLMTEDPLIGTLVLILIFPAGIIIWGAVPEKNIEVIFLAFIVVVVTVLIIIVPLLIVKANRGSKTEQDTAKIKRLEAEATRRQKTWQNDQERADKVINAKVKNLEAQTTFLMDNSDRYEKALLTQSAKEISDGMQARFDELQFVKSDSCLSRVAQVLEAFKKVEKDYDTILSEITDLKANLGIISRSASSEPSVPPKVIINEAIEKPLGEAVSKVTDKESIPIEHGEKIDEFFESQVNLKVESKPQGTEIDAPLKEAISILDGLTDETDEDDMPKEAEEELAKDLDSIREDLSVPISPTVWKCPRCGRLNNLKANRCPQCGKGRGS